MVVRTAHCLGDRSTTHHITWTGFLVALAMAAATAQPCEAGELKVIQKPTFWIVGPWTRILVDTPADCGKLEVTYPDRRVLTNSRSR